MNIFWWPLPLGWLHILLPRVGSERVCIKHSGYSYSLSDCTKFKPFTRNFYFPAPSICSMLNCYLSWVWPLKEALIVYHKLSHWKWVTSDCECRNFTRSKHHQAASLVPNRALTPELSCTSGPTWGKLQGMHQTGLVQSTAVCEYNHMMRACISGLSHVHWVFNDLQSALNCGSSPPVQSDLNCCPLP